MIALIDPVERFAYELSKSGFAGDSMGDPWAFAPNREQAFALARAALTAAEAAGMVWVPKEATLEMVQAAIRRPADNGIALDSWRSVWTAMIAARPSVTGPEQATREGQ